MPTQAYKDWKAAIRQRIWVAPNEPRNLRASHDAMFASAMTDLSQNCSRLQVNHTNVFPACSTYVDRALSIVDQPPGLVRRVYTVANADWSDRVHYHPRSFKVLENRARNLITDWVAPANEGLPALQQGVRFAESSTDSPYGRARTGFWATERNRFYLYPWVQSNEYIVIEWDGHKQTWGDEDLLDTDLWTPQHADAVEWYVRWRHEMIYGTDRQLRMDFENKWLEARADLMWQNEQQTREQESQEPVNVRPMSSAELLDDAVPAAPGNSYAWAFISDYGYPFNVYAGQVAALVKSWGPKFIVTGGDNMQPGQLGTATTYAATVGAFYPEYVGSNLAENKFWPAIGNHDYTDTANGIADYLAYFPFLPGSQRYYDFIKGSVHFFVLNSNALEADGLASTGTMAKWLQVKLKLSTAPWKVVVLHHPPYSAGSYYPGSTTLRWPFKTWGADLVLSGHSHSYERFEVDGLAYIVAGTGGGDLHGQAASYPLVSAYLKASDYTHHGALYVTASCTALDVKFVDTAGTVRDTLTLAKVGSVTPVVTPPGTPPAAGVTTAVTSLEVKDFYLTMPDGTKVKFTPVLVEGDWQLKLE